LKVSAEEIKMSKASIRERQKADSVNTKTPSMAGWRNRKEKEFRVRSAMVGLRGRIKIRKGLVLGGTQS
jgi:hypothetical protein